MTENKQTCGHQGTVAWNPEEEEHQCMTCGSLMYSEDHVQEVLSMQEEVFSRVSASIIRQLVTSSEPEVAGPSSPQELEPCAGSPTGRHFFSLGSTNCADCGAEAR